ncbi:MAG: hypothetical protein RI897_4234 [Verrucomicrobiota bacterium]
MVIGDQDTAAGELWGWGGGVGGVGDIESAGEPEGGALSGGAFDSDLPSHEFDELF